MSAYWNAQQSSTGHVWQGRFYSCPLDESHLWKALRYVELNPVRAGMVARAEMWRWSSAAAHCGGSDLGPMLEMERWSKRWTAAEWQKFIGDAESVADVGALRHSTHTGRPLGSQHFVEALEELTSRPLAPRKGRRSKKPSADSQASQPYLCCLASEHCKKPGYVPSVPRFVMIPMTRLRPSSIPAS